MQAYDFYNSLNTNKIIFDISKEEKIECERILNFKIPKKHIGIILLCSRDSDYNEKVFGNTDWSSLDYRNYDINIFRETIAYLNQKKYVVLRMGKSTKYKIDEKDNSHQKIFWKTYFKNIRHSDDLLFHLRDYNKIDNFSYSYLRNNSVCLD